MDKNNSKNFETGIIHRLTTQEMEKCQTRCGYEFKITSLFFDDLKPHYPTLVLGFINTSKGKKVLAKWNQYGQCWVSNNRHESFDLITSSQKVINEAKQALNV